MMAADTAGFALVLVSLVGVGVVAGLVAGLLGVGGGIVMTPALHFAFVAMDVAPTEAIHAAVATSLAVIVPTSLLSGRAHHKRGAVDWRFVRRWAVWFALGGAAGGTLASYLPGVVLAVAFATLAAGVAARMLTTAKREPVAREPGRVMLWGSGTGIGMLSAMAGVGGGSLATPFMLWTGRRIHIAVGSSAVLGFVLALPGVLAHIVSGVGVAAKALPWSVGYIHLPSLAAVGLASTLAAPWGAKLAHMLPRVALQRGFAIFLILVSLNMIRQAPF